MEIVKNIIIAIYLIVCVALVFLITKQSKEDSGASGKQCCRCLEWSGGWCADV